jgi:dolichyl-phosphate beta-glucosyltransferase
MYQEIYVSVVIPAYNEASRIRSTLEAVDAHLAKKGYAYEIIVVDDGSTDETERVVSDFCHTHPHCRLMSYRPNAGKGNAVRAGMLEARGERRLFMDADSSVSIAYIDAFLSYMDEGYDVVIASIEVEGAKVEEHNIFYRRFLGHLSKGLIRTTVTPGIYDTQRGFKLFTRSAASTIFTKQTIRGFGFDIELLVIALTNDMRVKEVPVVWVNPAGSSVGLRSYIATLRELLVIKYSSMVGLYRDGGYRRALGVADHR